MGRIARLDEVAPRRIRVQAAVWVTELHGPDRDAALELQVRRWIAQDPRHAAAFELATEAWQRSGDLPAPFPKPRPEATARRPRVKLIAPVIAAGAVLCGILAAAAYFLQQREIITGPGEQKTVELSDGSQVSLNANTRIALQYDDRVRRVTLEAGEAIFDVAKHQPRPFVAIVGDRKVVAVGTSFLIRREDPHETAFAVTLMEGRVAVEPASWPDSLAVRPTPGVKLLSPGERLQFRKDSDGTLDAPSVEKITAWTRGRIIFDDTSLRDAAAEFNRYGTPRILIDGDSAASLRVGGVFAVHDPRSFALAMANAYHLRIRDSNGEIILIDPDYHPPQK